MSIAMSTPEACERSSHAIRMTVHARVLAACFVILFVCGASPAPRRTGLTRDPRSVG